jgi:hypothetical protein
LRRPDLDGLLQIGILPLEAVFQEPDFRHGGQQLFVLPLPRDGMREHLTHQHDARNQIVWPVAGFFEGRERNGADNPAANPKRDAQM